jgi:hypothetical protein
MSLSPNLSLLAATSSLDELEEAEAVGTYIKLQDWPSMKHYVMRTADIEFHIDWCEAVLREEFVKRGERVYYWNKLSQLQFPQLQHYYVIERGEKDYWVTPVEFELIKTVVASKL